MHSIRLQPEPLRRAQRRHTRVADSDDAARARRGAHHTDPYAHTATAAVTGAATAAVAATVAAASSLPADRASDISRPRRSPRRHRPSNHPLPHHSPRAFPSQLHTVDTETAAMSAVNAADAPAAAAAAPAVAAAFSPPPPPHRRSPLSPHPSSSPSSPFLLTLLWPTAIIVRPQTPFQPENISFPPLAIDFESNDRERLVQHSTRSKNQVRVDCQESAFSNPAHSSARSPSKQREEKQRRSLRRSNGEA